MSMQWNTAQSTVIDRAIADGLLTETQARGLHLCTGCGMLTDTAENYVTHLSIWHGMEDAVIGDGSVKG
jgi:hypothetical protein